MKPTHLSLYLYLDKSSVVLLVPRSENRTSLEMVVVTVLEVGALGMRRYHKKRNSVIRVTSLQAIMVTLPWKLMSLCNTVQLSRTIFFHFFSIWIRMLKRFLMLIHERTAIL